MDQILFMICTLLGLHARVCSSYVCKNPLRRKWMLKSSLPFRFSPGIFQFSWWFDERTVFAAGHKNGSFQVLAKKSGFKCLSILFLVIETAKQRQPRKAFLEAPEELGEGDANSNLPMSSLTNHQFVGNPKLCHQGMLESRGALDLSVEMPSQIADVCLGLEKLVGFGGSKFHKFCEMWLEISENQGFHPSPHLRTCKARQTKKDLFLSVMARWV